MGNHHMGNYEEILVRKHLKRTKARVMIMKVLDKSLPMTAGEVYEAVRGKDTRLSLSTVYRNCEALAEKACSYAPPCWMTALPVTNTPRARRYTTPSASPVTKSFRWTWNWKRDTNGTWTGNTASKR